MRFINEEEMAEKMYRVKKRCSWKMMKKRYILYAYVKLHKKRKKSDVKLQCMLGKQKKK